MDRLKSNLHFKMMALSYKIRDFLWPRADVLKEVGIKKGDVLLDYGCGPGSYIEICAELVGPNGKIFALDIHPLAIRKVNKIISRKRLNNVETILSECHSGLADESVDIALLYDTLHNLNDPDSILAELHRVLKQGGTLSVNDHHLEDDDIISKISGNKLFQLHHKGEINLNFKPFK